jgi:hypothetical protein
MIPTFFLAIGAVFFWMVFSGFSSQEIKGRGWGFSVRIYRRDSEPIMYWVTFSSYLVCAIWATVFGVLAALKMLAKHGA